MITLKNFLKKYDFPGSVVLLEGKRIVDERDIPKGTAMNIDSYGNEGEDGYLKFCADETLDIYEFVLAYSDKDLRKADPRDKRGVEKEYKRPVFVVQ